MKLIRKMARLGRVFARLKRDDAGSNALEYGLIVGLISLAVVTGATTAGASLGTLFTTVGTHVAQVASTVSTP